MKRTTKKAKLTDFIKLGTRDRWRDVSTAEIWAKRIDSDTDSCFWISFSASASRTKVLKVIGKLIAQARINRAVYRRADADAYKAAQRGVGEHRANLDAALAKLSDDMDGLEGQAAVTNAPSRLPEHLAEATAGARATPWPSPSKLPQRPHLVSLTEQGALVGRRKGSKDQMAAKIRQRAGERYREVSEVSGGYYYSSHASRCERVAALLKQQDGYRISGKRLQAILRPLYRKPNRKRR